MSRPAKKRTLKTLIASHIKRLRATDKRFELNQYVEGLKQANPKLYETVAKENQLYY